MYFLIQDIYIYDFISVIGNMLDPPPYPPPLFLCASPAPLPTLNFLSFHLSLLHLFLCPSLFPLSVCVRACVRACVRVCAYVCICKSVWRKCLLLCVYKCDKKLLKK